MESKFSNRYLVAVEGSYKAVHYAVEERDQHGRITKDRLADIIDRSLTEEASLEDVALVGSSVEHVDFVEERLRSLYRSGNGKVRYIAPFFQTNACLEHGCEECEWSASKGTKRVLLKPEQFEKQLEHLKAQGFGVVEMSNATHPALLEWDRFASYIDVARRYTDFGKGDGFGICSASFDEGTFEKIISSLGNSFFWVQWMETYNLSDYFNYNLHRFSGKFPKRLRKFQKANFTRRLDTYDTVMSLGGDVMLGVQYGVSEDPLADSLMAIQHSRYLGGTYGRLPLSFGTVINNPTNGKRFSDGLKRDFGTEEHRALVAACKVAMPQMSRWLNTRWEWRNIKGAILDDDFYSGECSQMIPGAREGLVQLTPEIKRAAQFQVYEIPEKKEWEDRLSKIGLGVDYRWKK